MRANPRVFLTAFLLFSATFNTRASELGSTANVPMVVIERTGGRCRVAFRFPAKEPTAVIVPVASKMEGTDLRHISRELLERIEVQTAPRLIPSRACSQSGAIPISSRPFGARGTAEGRTGDPSQVVRWLSTLGFRSQDAARRIQAVVQGDTPLLAIFGWGQSVVIDCPVGGLPSIVWLGKSSHPSEAIWILAEAQTNWRSERVPVIVPPSPISVPKCTAQRADRLYRSILVPVQSKAVESLVVEHASDFLRCERCRENEAMTENDWESIFPIQAGGEKSKLARRFLYRVRWKTPEAGVFRELKWVAEQEPLQFSIEFPMVGMDCPKGVGVGSAAEESKAWQSLARLTHLSESALRSTLCPKP